MRICRRGKFVCIITYILLFSLPLVLLPEPAWVLAQQQTGENLLKQGKQLYMEGRFEEAVEKLALAFRMLTDKDKLIDAYLHLALSHFALGERDKAKENLAGLLRLNPAQKLDPLYYPPDFINLFNEAKQSILARLKVETEPPDAQVYLDGELVGLAPLELPEIGAGEHKLIVVKEGYKAKEESVSVKEGEEKTISIKLDKKEKKPVVAVTPAEKKPEVKKGKGWLWILIGGAAAAAVAILASKGGKETSAAPTPAQAFGSIQVKSYPNSATIFLDGQNTGFKTNHTLTNVPTGNHTILLRLAGWKDWQDEVTVNKDQTAVVKPCLLPPNGCFRDNFQDGDADDWYLDTGWRIKKEGGNYFLEGNTSEPWRAFKVIPLTENRSNFKLRFRLKILNHGEPGEFNVALRQWGDNRYLFGIRLRYIYLRGKNEILGEYYVPLGRGKWHNFEIVARGGNFQIFLDNNLILNINDPDPILEKGNIEFTNWSEIHSHFDDIVIISEEECP